MRRSISSWLVSKDVTPIIGPPGRFVIRNVFSVVTVRRVVPLKQITIFHDQRSSIIRVPWVARIPVDNEVRFDDLLNVGLLACPLQEFSFGSGEFKVRIRIPDSRINREVNRGCVAGERTESEIIRWNVGSHAAAAPSNSREQNQQTKMVASIHHTKLTLPERCRSEATGNGSCFETGSVGNPAFFISLFAVCWQLAQDDCVKEGE